MNRIASVMKMHYRDKTTWFLVPAMVLGSSFFVNFFIGLIGGIEMYTGGLLSIFVYLFIMGIVVLPQTFNFALSFSIRRKDYFSGTALYAIVSSVVVSIGLLLLSIIESDLTNNWGTRLHFFNVPYVNDGTLLQQLFIYFMVTLALFFSGLTIGSIYRRFRGIGMLVMTIILVALFTIQFLLINYYQWWEAILHWFSSHTAFELSLWLLPLTLLCSLLSYFLLRKATI